MAQLPSTTLRPRPRAGAARAAPVLVLGLAGNRSLAWWTDPIRLIAFILLPIFCSAAYFNRFSFWMFNASEDFVTRQTFWLGIYSMGLLVSGILIGRLIVPRRDLVSLLEKERALRVLTMLGAITILAYVLLLGSVVIDYTLVVSLLRGDPSAASNLRDAMGRIPGITSFVQFGVPYLVFVSVLVSMTSLRLPTRLWVMTGVVFGLTFVRAIVASERLALIEALAAVAIVPIAYRWRATTFRALAPFIGILAIFLAFAAGEYVRSWQYYQAYNDSYWSFITQRFYGYFSTSINNGAGAYLMYGSWAPRPEITVGWFTKFPVIGSILFPPPKITLMDQFLNTYATPEFNNPGGLYAAFLDFHFVPASVLMTMLGVVIGMVHRLFLNKSLAGLLLYPVVFLGITDLIRIVYIIDTRTLPIFIGVAVVVWAVRAKQAPRDRLRLGRAPTNGLEPARA
jgi:hypothetical protein